MALNNNQNIYSNNDSGNTDLTSSEFRSYNILARKMLQEGNLDGALINFSKIHSIFGCAYCKFLAGELEEALILLLFIKESSCAANWLITLINILNGSKNEYPTYLQIRTFYEQDLNMLLFYNQIELAQKLINSNDYLEHFNREIYKFSARVLNNYNYTKQAEQLLKKSLDIYYNDPETHYILGEIYLKYGEIQKAKDSFRTSNSVLGTYLPALKKLNYLSAD